MNILSKIFSKRKIMIVEDEAPLRLALATKLKNAGFEVIEVSNGNKVVSEVQLNKPDLIVFDIMLPGMSGTSALKLIRGQDMNISVPVIFLTNSSFDSNLKDIAQEYEATYLDKATTPIDKVVSVVKELLN